MKHGASLFGFLAIRRLCAPLTILAGLVWCGTIALGQVSDTKTETLQSSKYGSGGKAIFTTTTTGSSERAVIKWEDPQGKLRQLEFIESNVKGEKSQNDYYYDCDGRISYLVFVKKDSSGKVVSYQFERYRDGELKVGQYYKVDEKTHTLESYKEYDPDTKIYEDKEYKGQLKEQVGEISFVEPDPSTCPIATSVSAPLIDLNRLQPSIDRADTETAGVPTPSAGTPATNPGYGASVPPPLMPGNVGMPWEIPPSGIPWEIPPSSPGPMPPGGFPWERLPMKR